MPTLTMQRDMTLKGCNPDFKNARRYHQVVFEDVRRYVPPRLYT